MIITVLAARCGAGSASSDTSSVNPCSLLHEQEITTQIDLSLDTGQRAENRRHNRRHEILKEEVRDGPWPKCNIIWRSVDHAGQQWHTGKFHVYVITADQLEAVGGLDRGAAIEGIGDEALYVEHAPYARVGKVAVGISEFPDTHEGKGAVELLRAAVQRLPR